MSSDSVKSYFENLDLSDRILSFEESVATVKLAAERIGCDTNRIVKSLAYNMSEGPAVVVMAGNVRADRRLLKEKFGPDTEMVPTDTLKKTIGHELGGVCPFLLNDGVNVFLDESLEPGSMLYLGAGDDRTIVSLTLEELGELTGHKGWSDIGKR